MNRVTAYGRWRCLDIMGYIISRNRSESISEKWVFFFADDASGIYRKRPFGLLYIGKSWLRPQYEVVLKKFVVCIIPARGYSDRCAILICMPCLIEWTVFTKGILEQSRG